MIKSLKKQKGFTLIELMVVIVIIGILVAIALPNFIGAQDRAKISSVKANMHTMQTMVETYGVDWGGSYPDDVSALNTEAVGNSNPYWKDFTNPFTSKVGVATGNDGTLGSYADQATSATKPGIGVTGYDNGIITSTASLQYRIYGGDKTGAHIVDKGRTLVLSNS